MKDSAHDLKKALRDEKKSRGDLQDLVKTLYLTLKIEELSLKDARSMLELISDRLKPSNGEDMDV